MRISDFATEVLNILGRGGSNLDTALQTRLLPDATTPAHNPGIVNRAILRLARNWAWKELRILDATSFDTVASQAHIDISSADPIRNIVSVRLLDDANSRPLTRVNDSRMMDKTIPDATQVAEGYPNYYCEDRLVLSDVNTHCLVLYPIPNGAYDISIRYSKWPDTYAATETPELTQIDDLILNLATSMTYAAVGEYPQAVFWYQNNYMPVLQEAVALEATDPDWDKVWMGHTSPPDLGRSLDLSPWLDPFVLR